MLCSFTGIGMVNIRNTWFDFDGRSLHSTSPFTGERYSLVYFAHEAALRIPATVAASQSLTPTRDAEEQHLRQYLEALGMVWPPERPYEKANCIAPGVVPRVEARNKNHAQWEARYGYRVVAKRTNTVKTGTTVPPAGHTEFSWGSTQEGASLLSSSALLTAADKTIQRASSEIGSVEAVVLPVGHTEFSWLGGIGIRAGI